VRRRVCGNSVIIKRAGRRLQEFVSTLEHTPVGRYLIFLLDCYNSFQNSNDNEGSQSFGMLCSTLESSACSSMTHTLYSARDQSTKHLKCNKNKLIYTVVNHMKKYAPSINSFKSLVITTIVHSLGDHLMVIVD
jgi:hypothetical protein